MISGSPARLALRGAFLFCLCVWLPAGPAAGQLFFRATTAIPQLRYGSADAADVNRDGRIDLVVTGMMETGSPTTRIYVYLSSSVTYDRGQISVIQIEYQDVTTLAPPLGAGVARWGDYEGDGDVDLLVLGLRRSDDPGSRLSALLYDDGVNLRPDGSGVLTPLSAPAAAWGDYDGDGDLDLAVAGHDGTRRLARIYRNDGAAPGAPAAFEDIGAELVGVEYGSVDWGDYDGDGDLDLALTGYADGGPVTLVYRNDQGAFARAAALRGVLRGSASWGDYDGDGDLDLLVSGCVVGPGLCEGLTLVYRNDGGTFAEQDLGLPRVAGPSAWGDYDADGDLDVLLSGSPDLFSTAYIYVFENDGGTFRRTAQMPGFQLSSVMWTDVNDDDRLDILSLGEVGDAGRVAIWVNTELL